MKTEQQIKDKKAEIKLKRDLAPPFSDERHRLIAILITLEWVLSDSFTTHL